jgi:hypothetical protein
MSQGTNTSANDSLAPGTETLGVASTADVATQSSNGATESLAPAVNVAMAAAHAMRYPLVEGANDTVTEYVFGNLGWIRGFWAFNQTDIRLYHWYGEDETTVAAVKTATGEIRESDLLEGINVQPIPTGVLRWRYNRGLFAGERSAFGSVGQSDDGDRGSYLLVSRGGRCLLDAGDFHTRVESVYDAAFTSAGEDADYGDDEARWLESLTSVYDEYIESQRGPGAAVMGHSPSQVLESCDVDHYIAHKLQQRKQSADDEAAYAEIRQPQHQQHQQQEFESMLSGFDNLSF